MKSGCRPPNTLQRALGQHALGGASFHLLSQISHGADASCECTIRKAESWQANALAEIWVAPRATRRGDRIRKFAAMRMSAFGGEFNESTQHLLILADEEVCEWRGMHGHGSRRNRRLSCGSAGRAVNVWRTSRERLRGGTRAASIGSWLAMEGLLQRHAGGLW